MTMTPPCQWINDPGQNTREGLYKCIYCIALLVNTLCKLCFDADIPVARSGKKKRSFFSKPTEKKNDTQENNLETRRKQLDNTKDIDQIEENGEEENENENRNQANQEMDGGRNEKRKMKHVNKYDLQNSKSRKCAEMFLSILILLINH